MARARIRRRLLCSWCPGVLVAELPAIHAVSEPAGAGAYGQTGVAADVDILIPVYPKNLVSFAF